MVDEAVPRPAFAREMTLHDRALGQADDIAGLHAALRRARECLRSDCEDLQVLGAVVAGQIRAELRRRGRCA